MTSDLGHRVVMVHEGSKTRRGESLRLLGAVLLGCEKTSAGTAPSVVSARPSGHASMAVRASWGSPRARGAVSDLSRSGRQLPERYRTDANDLRDPIPCEQKIFMWITISKLCEGFRKISCEKSVSNKLHAKSCGLVMDSLRVSLARTSSVGATMSR